MHFKDSFWLDCVFCVPKFTVELTCLNILYIHFKQAIIVIPHSQIKHKM